MLALASLNKYVSTTKFRMEMGEYCNNGIQRGELDDLHGSVRCLLPGAHLCEQSQGSEVCLKESGLLVSGPVLWSFNIPSSLYGDNAPGCKQFFISKDSESLDTWTIG